VAAPGAGRALMELAMGPVGAGLALVAVYEMLKKSLEDDEAEMDKIAEAASKPETGGIKAVQDAWDSAAESLGKYYAKMSTAGEDNDPVATQIKRVKEMADAQTEASKKIVEALGQSTIARLRDSGASKEQIALAEANLKSQLAALDQQKEHATGSASLAEEQRARLAQNNKLKSDADAATEAAAAAKKKFTDDQEVLKHAREALAAPDTEKGSLAERLKNANAKMEDAQSIPDQTVTSGSFGAVVTDNSAMKNKAIADAQDEIDKVNAEVAARKKEKAQLEASEKDRSKAKEIADEDARRKQEASEKNQGRLRELPGEITQANNVEATKDHAQQVIDVLNNHGAKSTATLGEVATAIGLTEQQRLNIAERILKHTMTVQQAWAGIEQRLAQLEAQGKHVTFNGR